MERDSHTYSLREFLATIFKHKYKICTVFITTVITVTVGSYMASPTYEAETSLLVKLGRENIYRPEVGNSTRIFSSDPEKILNTEIKILTTQDLMEKVVKQLGVKNIYPNLVEGPKKNKTQLESAAIKFKNKISVGITGYMYKVAEKLGLENIHSKQIKRPKKTMTPLESATIKFKNNISVGIAIKSDVIDITFQHRDPNIVARALNLLVKLYQEKHTKVFGNSVSSYLIRN